MPTFWTTASGALRLSSVNWPIAEMRRSFATPVGGIPEVVTDRVNGLLVPPGGPEALAAAIMRLLEAKDLRIRLGRAGRERVERDFSVERMVDGNLDVYREVLGC